MNWKKFLTVAVIALAVVTQGATRLAVAVPQVKGKALTAEEAAGLADILETRIDGNYELISRAALSPILLELDFQEGSGMVMTEEQRAAFGEMKGVDLLLVSTVSRIGGKVFLSMSVIEPSSGKILPTQRRTISGATVDDLLNHLDGALQEMGLAREAGQTGKPVLAVFELKLDQVKPDFPLQRTLTAKLENDIRKANVFALVTRQDIDRVREESAFAGDPLANPDQYAKIGELLVANYVLTGTITRFECDEIELKNELTGGIPSKRYVWKAAVDLRLVRLVDGVVIAADTVEVTLRERDIPAAKRRDWTKRDWQNALLDRLAAKLAAMVALPEEPAVVPAEVAAAPKPVEETTPEAE